MGSWGPWARGVHGLVCQGTALVARSEPGDRRFRGRVGRVNGFDGRSMGVGIAVGVLVGLLVAYFTENPVWVSLLAAIGALIGISRNWFDRS